MHVNPSGRETIKHIWTGMTIAIFHNRDSLSRLQVLAAYHATYKSMRLWRINKVFFDIVGQFTVHVGLIFGLEQGWQITSLLIQTRRTRLKHDKALHSCLSNTNKTRVTCVQTGAGFQVAIHKPPSKMLQLVGSLLIQR